MSRRDLADAVNAYLWEKHRSVDHLDDNDVGKYERGEHRWPSQVRREAFRAVLRVSKDDQLGFFVMRGLAHRPSVPKCAASVGPDDPTAVTAAVPDPPAIDQPAETPYDESGLHWHQSLDDSVRLVGMLWRADLERQEMLRRSPWLAASLAVPIRDWLLDLADDDSAHSGSRAVGGTDVEVVRSMCSTFADVDHRLGGGYARAALAQYVKDSALPLLEGTYTERVGRQLLSAVARLCDLGGFMAFDCGLSGLAQRYFIQALRLAQASQDRVLGAHILTDMAMQAHYLGDASEARALARAARHTAAATASQATAARSCALEARAHALAGDHRRCATAMTEAEAALDQVRLEDEPDWIRFFDLHQLHTEFAYAFSDLGQAAQVQRLAPAAINASGQMERRRVLLSATLAASYLGDRDQRGSEPVDVEQACAVLGDAVTVIGSLHTERVHRAIARVRDRLRPYADHQDVQQLGQLLRLSGLAGPDSHGSPGGSPTGCASS